MQNPFSRSKLFRLLDWILRYALFHGFATLCSHLRSLGYAGGLVRLRVQTNFDTSFNRQQAPFFGAIAGEQVIKIQSSLRL
jgi:hypothetical protein